LNDYLLSLILGIVEGITEFLPVSSTAHLRLSELLLHINLSDGYWKMYSIVIQLGGNPVSSRLFLESHHQIPLDFSERRKRKQDCPHASSRPHHRRLRGYRDSIIPSHQSDREASRKHRNHWLVAADRGIVMWIVDAMHAKAEAAGPGASSRISTWKMEDMSLGQAIWIGFCQIFSGVFPGTSRSMSTIAGGQLAGMSRASALEFSFFCLFIRWPRRRSTRSTNRFAVKAEKSDRVAQIDAHGWIVLAIGFVVSFFVAYGSVAWFMGYVRKRGFVPFAIYRIIIGALVLVFAAKLV